MAVMLVLYKNGNLSGMGKWKFGYEKASALPHLQKIFFKANFKQSCSDNLCISQTLHVNMEKVIFLASVNLASTYLEYLHV